MSQTYPDDWMGYDDADECWNCGGEGYVYSCVEEYACVDPEGGCDFCERRCEVCNPKAARRLSMSEEEALLPCPFCGGTPRLLRWEGDAHVECENCNNRTSNWDEHVANLAIAAWNNRRSSPAQAAMPWQPRHTNNSPELFAHPAPSVPPPLPEDHFLMAYASKDGKVTGIDHDTNASWQDVLTAHIALRDWLNERIANQRSCPRSPPSGHIHALVPPNPAPPLPGEVGTMVERLKKHLVSLSVGSCSCLTKTPEIEHHSEWCPYRKAMLALGDADKLVAELTRLNKWADGFSDAQLKERRLAQEHIREQAAKVAAQAAELERVSRYHATAQRQLDAVDAPLKWEGTGKGRVERVHELLAAEAALASAKAEVERRNEALRELANAARSACDARQHTDLINALVEADRLSLLEPSEEPK